MSETVENVYDLERSVLGSMLWLEDQPVPEWAERVHADMFLDANHRQIAMAVDDLIGAQAPIDAIAVTDKLHGWGVRLAPQVAELQESCATTANLNHHARRLAERAQIRKFRERASDLLKKIDRTEPSEIRAELQLLEQIMEPMAGTNGLKPIRELIPQTLSELEAEHEGKAGPIVKTEIGVLDRFLELHKGELTILAGRPSMGKTALAIRFARYAAKQRHHGSVAFFSLEMKDTALLRRMICAEAATEKHMVAALHVRGEITEAINELFRLDLLIDDRPKLNVDAMRAGLRRLNKVQLVVVDYLQLVKTKTAERRDLAVGDVGKELKALAKEFGCHVIALAQLNRSVESRNPPMPRLSDLRDSGNLEEDADNAVLLYRPEYYDRDYSEPQEAQLNVAKQRNGPTKVLRLRWIKETQQFLDW